MNVNLYICIIAGISLVFYLLYPADSTYASSAMTTLMKGDLSAAEILNVLVTFGLDNAGVLLGSSIFVAVLATLFGASAVIPIVFNIGVFFIIPNLFILPTHLLLQGDSMGMLPVELKVTMMFIFNVMLLMTAIEFWR